MTNIEPLPVEPEVLPEPDTATTTADGPGGSDPYNPHGTKKP